MKWSNTEEQNQKKNYNHQTTCVWVQVDNNFWKSIRSMLIAISLEGTQRHKFIRCRWIAQINQQNLAALNYSSSKTYLFHQGLWLACITRDRVLWGSWLWGKTLKSLLTKKKIIILLFWALQTHLLHKSGHYLSMTSYPQLKKPLKCQSQPHSSISETKRKNGM